MQGMNLEWKVDATKKQMLQMIQIPLIVVAATSQLLYLMKCAGECQLLHLDSSVLRKQVWKILLLFHRRTPSCIYHWTSWLSLHLAYSVDEHSLLTF